MGQSWLTLNARRQIMCNTRRITVNRVKECGRYTQQLYLLYILKVQTELKVIFRMMNKLQ